MTWAKLSDDYPDQTARLSDAAFRTHTEGLCWTMRRETGGHIMRRDLLRFAETDLPNEAVAELVSLGYWVEQSDGWRIVHHMEHQPEPDVIRKRRENDAERQRRARRKKAGLSSDHNDAVTGYPPVGASRPDPSRPDPGHVDCHAVTADQVVVRPDKGGTGGRAVCDGSCVPLADGATACTWCDKPLEGIRG